MGGGERRGWVGAEREAGSGEVLKLGGGGRREERREGEILRSCAIRCACVRSTHRKRANLASLAARACTGCITGNNGWLPTMPLYSRVVWLPDAGLTMKLLFSAVKCLAL